MEVEDVAPEQRALTATDFAVDPNVEDPAVCPAGHFATEQIQRATQPNRVVLTFDRETCNACALLHACSAPLNEEGGDYVLRVDLVAANIERRRRAIASGARGTEGWIRAAAPKPAARWLIGIALPIRFISSRPSNDRISSLLKTEFLRGSQPWLSPQRLPDTNEA